MGYTTQFKGHFRLSRRLKPEEHAKLSELASERRGTNLLSTDGYPSLYCRWTPSEDGRYIQWDGGEKFYEYFRWLSWIIDRHLEPWGITATGTVTWKGEREDDRGKIRLVRSVVTVTRWKVPRRKKVTKQ